MDLDSIIEKLHRERMKLDEIIASLQQLQQSYAAVAKEGLKRRGRKSMGAEERQQVSARMKSYWESRRTGVSFNQPGLNAKVASA
jgi:hypothetical protein